jgi:hypothetical protein
LGKVIVVACRVGVDARFYDRHFCTDELLVVKDKRMGLGFSSAKIAFWRDMVDKS